MFTSRIKALLCRLLYRAGAAELYRIAVNARDHGVVRILSAHRVVGDRDAGPGDAPVHLTRSDFARRIRYLGRHYEFASLDRCVAGGSFPENCVLLTFDDGFRDVYTDVFPVLEQEGVPFTVFVTSGFVGRDNMLTEAEIREMARSDIVSWGAHGETHHSLADIPLPEAQREISGSREELERILGRDVRLFCYPDGKYNDELRRLLADQGFSAACATGRDLNRSGADLFALKRIPFEAEPIERFAFRVAGMV